MTTTCPQCQSERVVTKDVAKKACGYLGLVGGVATGSAGLFGGAELGAMVGIAATRTLASLGGVAGILLGALVGAATAGVAGAQLGQAIDEHILDNYLCLDCDYSFSLKAS